MTDSILVVDDQPGLLANIRLALEAAGYQVLTASDGLEALELMRSQPVSLILADIAMPRLNGYQLFERVQENPAWVTIPFIFLTARAMDSDIRYGKQLGVDDYLTKPIEPEDLLAVVEGKLRRAERQTAAGETPRQRGSQDNILIAGRLRIDVRQHRAWVGEDEIDLSSREFALLTYLAQRPNEVISPQDLVRVTHNLETDLIDAGALIRPLILSVRRKLGELSGETSYIENVRSVGYRLVPLEG